MRGGEEERRVLALDASRLLVETHAANYIHSIPPRLDVVLLLKRETERGRAWRDVVTRRWRSPDRARIPRPQRHIPSVSRDGCRQAETRVLMLSSYSVQRL